MNLITVEEKIQLLKNLLEDPFDWVSKEILRLADEHERVDEQSSQVTSSAKYSDSNNNSG